ncbi:hypothetical protein CISIN_1g042809mg [Citrus sinensis]|uniref:Protein kinase domain-containing protein n=1 Tax=Citrus sinensis TaxID=2711 RepID=A0A067DK95_CITSI|nr:hypothetical protein CISIN_1g042809mg [Citrus sinensis]
MNKGTGALFVVKSAESEAGVQALRNEAEIRQSLNSPNIGRNGEKTVNIFMEYMAGGSLLDVAEKFGGTLDAGVIRLYTKEILHGNGILHCDLKCNNVLLGSHGDVKLPDLGCARRVNDLKNNGNLKQSWQSIGGTQLWMAPEVLRNEGLDFATDIWSLGCMVIEMATGRPPWGDKISNAAATLLKIACSNEKPHFPTQFFKKVLDFLAKCLERKPEKRWSAEELLNHTFISGNAKKNSTEE